MAALARASRIQLDRRTRFFIAGRSLLPVISHDWSGEIAWASAGKLPKGLSSSAEL